MQQAAAALCSDGVPPPSGDRSRLSSQRPTIVQRSQDTVIIAPIAGADAVFLTDESGSVVGFLRVAEPAVTEAEPAATEAVLNFGNNPSRLTAHVHLPSCATTTSPATATWRELLEAFDYMGSGGVLPDESRWSEARLQASAPRLTLAADADPAGGPPQAIASLLRVRVSLLQQPDLFVPLLFASCATSANAPYLLRRFSNVSWPALPRSFTALLTIPAKCTRLLACSSLPDGQKKGCGGQGPRRCARLDLRVPLADAIQRLHPRPRELEPREIASRLDRVVVLRPTTRCDLR
jgi:hypothetical protein